MVRADSSKGQTGTDNNNLIDLIYPLIRLGVLIGAGMFAIDNVPAANVWAVVAALLLVYTATLFVTGFESKALIKRQKSHTQ